MSAFEILPTYDDFQQLLNKKLPKKLPRPILLNVYRDECPNCMTPAAKRAIAAKYSEKLTLVEMSAETVPELEMNLGIDLVPTLLLRPGPGARKFVSVPDRNGKNVLRWLDQELDGSH